MATARVMVKGAKVQLFARHRNPMVYSGAVESIRGHPPSLGDAVLVCDDAGTAFAWGFYNPNSLYRVSEGDGLSGLTVDVLGSRVVVAASAAWCMRYQSEITAALAEVLRPATGATPPHIVWNPVVGILSKEEGWSFEGSGCSPGVDLEDRSPQGQGGKPPGNAFAGCAAAAADAQRLPPAITVREHGLRYLLDAEGPSQKTGYYADQRDSRALIRALSSGKRVLDLCCYTGGFALNAAAGGAVEVLGLDSAHRAVHAATANAALNRLDGVARFQRQDLKTWERGAATPGGGWDIVILDPPKLAPGRSTLRRATRQYAAYNAAAMRQVAPGGLLMTCSCSGAMTQSGGFMPMLQDAARLSGRELTVLRAAGPAPDHPLHPGYPEGQYLTNVLVRVA